MCVIPHIPISAKPIIYWVTWIKFLNTGAFTTKLIRVSTVLVFKADRTSYFIVFCAENCPLTLCTRYSKTSGNAVPFHQVLILRQSFARLNRCNVSFNCYEKDHDLRQNRICVWNNVLNWQWIMKFYPWLYHGHDLVQTEKLNGRGTSFPEVYIFKLGCQFGPLWQKFGCKMTSLGAMTTKLVAKLSPAQIWRQYMFWCQHS